MLPTQKQRWVLWNISVWKRFPRTERLEKHCPRGKLCTR
jgi:hypothetical protein